MTLASPTAGVVGHQNTGRLFLADISVPPSVCTGFGISLTTPFRKAPVVEVG